MGDLALTAQRAGAGGAAGHRQHKAGIVRNLRQAELGPAVRLLLVRHRHADAGALAGVGEAEVAGRAGARRQRDAVDAADELALLRRRDQRRQRDQAAGAQRAADRDDAEVAGARVVIGHVDRGVRGRRAAVRVDLQEPLAVAVVRGAEAGSRRRQRRQIQAGDGLRRGDVEHQAAQVRDAVVDLDAERTVAADERQPREIACGRRSLVVESHRASQRLRAHGRRGRDGALRRLAGGAPETEELAGDGVGERGLVDDEAARAVSQRVDELIAVGDRHGQTSVNRSRSAV